MVKNTYQTYCFRLFFALFLIVSYNSYAQITNKATNVGFLAQNALVLQEELNQNRALAFSMAKDKGWETLKVTKRGDIILLQGVDELGLPIYYTTYNNSIAANTTNTHQLYNGGSLGLNLSGSTVLNGQVAIWDGGAVLINHIELINRVLKKDNASTLSTHATHVAGTMMATGLYRVTKGMAYQLPQLLSFDFGSDLSEMSAHAATLLISNHSYGAIAGWNYNDDVSPARWEFWGSAGANEDYRFGYYNSAAKDWDLICYNAPYYLPVKSAGNNRSLNGPGLGSPYFRYNSAGVMSSAGNRPDGISSNNSYDIISTYGTAKNILTVGAVNPLPFGPATPSSIQISSFSSWGPTDDGRIKPDIVGDGVNVTSTSSANTTSYTTLSGTSMAAPNVSGSLVLLQELYSQKNSGALMRSATLKGLVIGTATEAGSNPGPDYVYGWGLLNMENAAKAILHKGQKSIIAEHTLNQGASQSITTTASGNGPLIATICWTDPEATPIPITNALNNNTLRLVNDLDIIATQGERIYRPWILDPSQPAAAATTGNNFRDNVEQIYIVDAIPGKNYTFTISHKGTLQRGPQAYSLIITGAGGTSYCTSAANNNADSKINAFKLANINYTAPANNCISYTDLTSQTIEMEKGKTYPLTLSLGTCGANLDKVAKVFIDWNGDGDFDDTEEHVATSMIINGTGEFSSNITVPHHVVINNFSLLRVVLMETNLVTSINACGAYNKGETLDYRVKFLNPSTDIAILNITSPLTTTCANNNQAIGLLIKNLGTQTLTNIPITVTITENTTVVATLKTNYIGSLSSQSETEIMLDESFNAQAGRLYHITAKANLLGDQVATNDTTIRQVQISLPPVANSGTAYLCASNNNYLLNTAVSNGTAFWYTNETSLSPIAFGNMATSLIKPDQNLFYVGVNDFKADVGVKHKNEIGDGGYNQFTSGISITTLAPMIIERAKLYIGNSGQIRFTVVDNSGVATSSVLLNVTATKHNPGEGVTANDLEDQGHVYALNLLFPTAGNYTINIEYLNGATIFRNNVSNTNYPYRTALDLFNITGNTATQDNNAAYFKTFYYYLYDIKIRANGCLGNQRLQVPLDVATITQNGKLLLSNFANHNQWYINGQRITGATSQQYTPLQNGIYSVEVNLNDGCILKSADLGVTTISRTPHQNDINLKTYPVPTNDELNIYFELPDKKQVTIQLSNILGKVIFNEEKINYSGIYSNKLNLRTFDTGVYILRVKVGSKIYNSKIILTRP